MMNKEIYIIAGPNGSGKTTFANEFLKDSNIEFINADNIAKELSPENFQKVRLKAGKIFFQKIEKCLIDNKSFLIETTLSGKYLLSLISDWKERGYKVTIIYVFVETEDEAVDRVEIRVKKGGHHIIEKDIRRRFLRSKNNFWNLYKDLIDDWELYLNNKDDFLQVAFGFKKEVHIVDEYNFDLFKEGVFE